MIEINKNWTLFLDRDGVINQEIQGHYVTHYGEFIFCDQALETITICSKLFKRILIVTNQRGVGRGIMSASDLATIHEKMLIEIKTAGGEIQKIYYCTDIDDDSTNRKPNTGMAEQAKQDYPDIEFNKSIMVGNNLSDMEFGKRMGMKTIFVKGTRPDVNSHALIDIALDSFACLPKVLKST